MNQQITDSDRREFLRTLVGLVLPGPKPLLGAVSALAGACFTGCRPEVTPKTAEAKPKPESQEFLDLKSAIERATPLQINFSREINTGGPTCVFLLDYGHLDPATQRNYVAALKQLNEIWPLDALGLELPPFSEEQRRRFNQELLRIKAPDALLDPSQRQPLEQMVQGYDYKWGVPETEELFRLSESNVKVLPLEVDYKLELDIATHKTVNDLLLDLWTQTGAGEQVIIKTTKGYSAPAFLVLRCSEYLHGRYADNQVPYPLIDFARLGQSSDGSVVVDWQNAHKITEQNAEAQAWFLKYGINNRNTTVANRISAEVISGSSRIGLLYGAGHSLSDYGGGPSSTIQEELAKHGVNIIIVNHVSDRIAHRSRLNG